MLQDPRLPMKRTTLRSCFSGLPKGRVFSFVGAVFTLFVVLLPTSCASKPMDLARDHCAPTTIKMGSSPLGDVVVRLRADRRPLREQGSSSFLGESTVADQDFRVPLIEGILRVVGRDARDAGLFRSASLLENRQAFRIDVVVDHARLGFTEGVSTLIPILPASSVEAHVALRFVFSDIDGRVYLDKAYEAKEDGSGSAIGNRKDAAADLFGKALRVVVDGFLIDARNAYETWWARFPDSRLTR